MRSHGWVSATVLVSLSLATAGCSSSPGSVAARLTERGRLLMEGPPARMTASAQSESRSDSVPLLYYFAVEAGQIPYPVDTNGAALPLPTRTVDQQQVALSNRINWAAVTLVGEGYIDTQCDRFLAALDELERSKRATLANLNALQSATVGIMGLALAAQQAIGIVGVAFGLAASLVDNTTSSVLYELPASSVRTIVMAQRNALREDEQTKDLLALVTNQGLTAARLSEYTQYCIPVTITANVAKVISSTKNQNGNIATTPVDPVVTSALVQHMSAIPVGTPISIVPPPPKAPLGKILSAADQKLKLRIFHAVRLASDQARIVTLANALRLPLSGDPEKDKRSIIVTINALLNHDNVNQYAQVVTDSLGALPP